MRNIQQFKSDRKLNRRFGVRQETESIYTDEQRQRVIEIYLQVREEEKVEEIARIAKAKESMKWHFEISPNHQTLVNQILAQRDADYRVYVAECEESLRG